MDERTESPLAAPGGVTQDERGHPVNPETMRRRLLAGNVTPQVFRAALTAVAANHRDAWVDELCGLDELPDDGPELPRGCVPYLPSSVDTLLRAVELARIGPDDVFVDIGSGAGRATALVHLLTGADAIGLEIQPALVDLSRQVALRLNASRVSCVQGDATTLIRQFGMGSVFFLYCPFSGDRLERVIDDLEAVARTRAFRLCGVDLPDLRRPWLEPVSRCDALTVYESA